MMKRTLKQFRNFVAVAGLALAPMLALAAQAPDVLVKSVSEEVLTIVRQDKAIQSGDRRKSLELIDAKVLPHFDFEGMTALALGRNWRQASADQKTVLTNEFRTLLVRSYTNALTNFKDYQISYLPLKMKDGDSEVIVRTNVRKVGQQPDSVDYVLHQVGGEWKVFDVAVAGASLITAYRDEFNQDVRSGGVDGLIQSLKSKNARNEGAPARK